MRKETIKKNVLFRADRRLIALLAVVVLLSACGYQPTPTAQLNLIDLDPAFRAFYKHLGGAIVLGDVISPMMENGPIKYQYVEAGKLTLDPQAPKEQMLRFAPLGREMGVTDPPVPPPDQPELYHDGQHIIYPDFLPLYEQLGADVFGLALSEMHYNPARKRYEQYFENLGIYRLEGTDQLFLLAYGVWDCGAECQNNTDTELAIIDISHHADEVFSAYHSWAGDLFGFALSEAYINKYGAWEQIFENAVLVTGAGENVSQVYLRPMVKEVNMPLDVPREMGAVEQEGYFSEVKPGKGYIIPNHFWNYIAARGGLSVFGAPVTHYAQVKPNYFRQCFTNLCLNYAPNAIKSLRIRPEPLGYVYQRLYDNRVTLIATPTPSTRVTTIKAWERYPALPSNQEQVVGISVLDNYAPVEFIEAELILFMPEGGRNLYAFPPTDARGQSFLTLPLVIASNGTLIEYHVCVPQQPSGDKFCVGESFIIWNNP